MNDIFESKGKLIAIFSIVIVIITAVAVYWAYKTINTDIDLEKLESEAIVEEEVEEPKEENPPEPVFTRAKKMRGVIITPGKDFLLTGDESKEEIETQIDEIIETAKKYEFNSIIINTSYQDGEEDKVIYAEPGTEPALEPEGEDTEETEIDIFNVVSQKTLSQGIYTYALVDISPYKNETNNQFTADSYADSYETSEIYTNLKDFAQRYQPDGIIVTGYQVELGQDERDEFADAGGEMSLDEYLVIGTELNLKASGQAVRDVSIDIQYGILADSVWENEEKNPQGSKTTATITALSDYHADIFSMISSEMFDLVMVDTSGKIGDENTDFAEITDWWDNLARETEAPIYIVMAASNVGSGYDNSELARQAKMVDEATQLEGSVFEGLSYLEKETESSKQLIGYYVEGEEVEEGTGPEIEKPATSEKPLTPTTPTPTPPTTITPTTPTTTEPEAIKLSTTALSLRVGETKQLVATVTPKTLTQEATWASGNREIATVDGAGNVKAIAKGETVIKATSVGGKVVECKVTVADAKTSTGDGVAVTEVSISHKDLSVAEGKTSQLSTEVRPDNATNKTVTWGSADAKIATVDTTGLVTGVAKGTTTITASSVDGKKTATCAVTVTAPGGSAGGDSSTLKDVKSITVSGSTSNMYIKSSQTMVVKDQNGKALANSLFDWETSNRDIARVDAAGVVSSKSTAGSATISAYNDDNSLYATFKITVSEERVKVTGITLNVSTVSVAVGKTNSSVKPTLEPANATVSDISWRVSNTNIATVDSSGVITGKSEGTTTLAVKSGNIQASCRIEVTGTVKVDDIYIDDSSFEMGVGATDFLSATVEPSGADVKLLWSSSSPSILEVDGNGNLTAKSEGTATITVKVEGSESYYDTIKVTVV